MLHRHLPLKEPTKAHWAHKAHWAATAAVHARLNLSPADVVCSRPWLCVDLVKNQLEDTARVRGMTVEQVRDNYVIWGCVRDT
jgi:hypothetical protein